MHNQQAFQILHQHILEIMPKIQRPAEGNYAYPYLKVSFGNTYSENVYGWDNHHMSLRFAASGDKEQMRYYLANMFHFQNSNGFVPCLNSATDLTLQLDFGFHAQPFLAQNAAIYAAIGGDEGFLRDTFPKLERYLEYYFRTMGGPFGLCHWAETYMSGIDNEICGSLYPSESILPPDLNSWLYLECRAMAYLAKQFGTEPEKWQNKSNALKTAINQHLWNEELGSYACFNTHSGKIQAALDSTAPGEIGRFAFISCVTFPLLYAGIALQERAEKMIQNYLLAPEHFRSRYGLRSLSALSEYYNNAVWGNPPRFGNFRRKTNSNWQGPIWVPANWFAFHGLLRYGFHAEAEAIMHDLHRTLAISIRDYGFMRENYCAETGRPLYADNFASWNILADLMPDYLQSNKKILPLFPWDE